MTDSNKISGWGGLTIKFLKKGVKRGTAGD